MQSRQWSTGVWYSCACPRVRLNSRLHKTMVHTRCYSLHGRAGHTALRDLIRDRATADFPSPRHAKAVLLLAPISALTRDPRSNVALVSWLVGKSGGMSAVAGIGRRSQLAAVVEPPLILDPEIDEKLGIRKGMAVTSASILRGLQPRRAAVSTSSRVRDAHEVGVTEPLPRSLVGPAAQQLLSAGGRCEVREGRDHTQEPLPRGRPAGLRAVPPPA